MRKLVTAQLDEKEVDELLISRIVKTKKAIWYCNVYSHLHQINIK